MALGMEMLALTDAALARICIGASRVSSGRRKRGDFTRWKEHDSYQSSFDRLMRDLRVEKPGQ